MSSSVQHKIFRDVVLISTSNLSMARFIGMSGRLFVAIGYSATFDMSLSYLYTSNVKEITEEDNRITLQTLNSIYTFMPKKEYEELLKDTRIDPKKPKRNTKKKQTKEKQDNE